MDLAVEFLFPTPSLVCSATVLRLLMFFFFFLVFVPEIEILSIRLSRPGYLHVYTLGVMYTSYTE